MRVLIFGKGGISQGIADVLEPEGHQVLQLTEEQADVTAPWQITRSIQEASPEWVINCAGVSYPGESHTGIQDEVLVNLLGAMFVAHLAHGIPQVHIASVAGLYGKPGHMGYSASKAGVISMVQSLALEGKQIWAISPGRVDTPMRERDYPQDTPGSRLEPQEIGRIVRQIMKGYWEPGTNVVIRKRGLHNILIEAHNGDGWKERLRVGEPVTI